MITKMTNPIQDYPWGSRVYLQELLGLESQGPLAEMWMGVHPRGMSMVESPDGTPLSLEELILKNPEEYLGSEVAGKFGDLPYLFKFLAAGEPLSIQAHPNKMQAEEGYERENREGIPLDAFNRNYKDDNHKPEIICAITDYWAMKGFRDASEIRKYFKYFSPEALFDTLCSGEDGAFHRQFFIALMNLAESDRKSLLGAALAFCDGSSDAACSWVIKLNEKYPGDISVLAPLYLNTVMLSPGEALYLPAGELHAYLQGFGMELMANSDNVLRGGLTEKYMDLKELEQTLLFEHSPVKRIQPRSQSDGTMVYPTPSGEFELLRLDTAQGNITLKENYPVAILAVFNGSLTITEDGQVVELKAGESCFLSGSAGPRTIQGGGSAFIARVPG